MPLAPCIAYNGVPMSGSFCPEAKFTRRFPSMQILVGVMEQSRVEVSESIAESRISEILTHTG